MTLFPTFQSLPPLFSSQASDEVPVTPTAIHLNLWDNGFPFCPLGADQHQESSVRSLTMRGRQTSLNLISVISIFISGMCYNSWKFSAITSFLSVIAISVFTDTSNIAWGPCLTDSVLGWYMISDLRHLWSQKPYMNFNSVSKVLKQNLGFRMLQLKKARWRQRRRVSARRDA